MILVQTQISEEETETLLSNNENPSLFVDNVRFISFLIQI